MTASTAEPPASDQIEKPITPSGGRGKGFLALAATMFLPGAGQFIAGRRRRGLIWLAIASLLTALATVAFTMPSLFPALIVVLPISVAISLAGWIDAFRVGRRSPRRMLGGPLVRYGVGVVLILLTLFAHPSLPFALFIRDHFAETFTLPTMSMSPTLEPGDRFVCHKRLEPRRWDVVAVRAPDLGNGRQIFTERLIGLPGEEVELRDGFVHVNGQRLDPPSGIGPYVSNPKIGSKPGNGCEGNPIRLGADEYYFLGDNSPVSADSRYWPTGSPGRQPGTLGQSDIVGVITTTYWPPSRWRRLHSAP